MLVATKAGSECCELPLKAPAEGKEKIQEVTASLAAAAKGISVDATVATGEPPRAGVATSFTRQQNT